MSDNIPIEEQEVIDLTEDNDDNMDEVEERRKYSFYVWQKPQALPRARRFRNIFVNPARKKLKAFQQEAAVHLPGSEHGPIFPKEVSLYVKLLFALPRPNSDFIGNQRDLDGLRLKTAVLQRGCCPPTGPDIDNMCKFVLDALNGIAYHDDRQVVKLVAVKQRVTSGDEDGFTHVTIKPFYID
jgi:Holliday junction resolvase RusA-like endonuclease